MRIVTVTFKGVECVVARDFGRALGYGKDGAKLVDMMREEWTDEFEPGVDALPLKGQELRDLKGLAPEAGRRFKRPFCPIGEVPGRQSLALADVFSSLHNPQLD